jgi:hypothetical protein
VFYTEKADKGGYWKVNADNEIIRTVPFDATFNKNATVDVADDFSSNQLMEILQLRHRPTFLYTYIQPAIELGLIEQTIPDKPNSSLQKYRLTPLGLNIKNLEK